MCGLRTLIAVHDSVAETQTISNSVFFSPPWQGGVGGVTDWTFTIKQESFQRAAAEMLRELGLSVSVTPPAPTCKDCPAFYRFSDKELCCVLSL